MVKKLSALIFLIALSHLSFSQGELALYQLHKSLPQANNLNPAFQPEHKVVIGFPVISSVRAFVDNDGLSFNDYFIYDDNDNLVLDTLGLPNKVGDVQNFGVAADIGLFYFGLRGKRSFFTFTINEVNDYKINYPGNLIRWAIQGPADPRIQGDNLALDGFGMKALSYYEVGLGYSREINSQLTLGLRLKYLQGLGTIDTEKVSGSVHIGSDSVTVVSGDILVNTAGISFAEEDDPDYSDYFLSNGNRGAAIDIGGSYNLTDKINLSASVKDIGFIKWSDYTRSYEVDPARYSYTGFDLLDLVNKTSDDEFLQAELDSIENLYDVREVDETSFTTMLRPKTYLGANYKLGKKHNAGALVYFDFFKGDINPSIALSYNLKLGRIFNIAVNTAFVNGTFTGIGAGFTLKLTGMQVYASSDQVRSAFYPSRASIVEAHTGINMVFGRVKEREKAVEEEEDEMEEVEEEMTEEEFLEQLDEQTIEEDSISTPVDTTQTEEPVVEEEPEPIIEEKLPTQADTLISTDTVSQQAPPAPQEEIVEEEPEELTEVYDKVNERTIIDQGNHPDELAPGHYVIVGVFGVKENATDYTKKLNAAGYQSQAGFVSKRGAYYIYVAKSAVNLKEIRETRDRFRQIEQFQFPKAWVLTMVE